MQDLQRVLAMAGMSLDDLVSLQVFASDVSHWERFNAVYRGYFKGQLPPRAFLGSGTLLFGARFELQGIAEVDSVLPRRRTAPYSQRGIAHLRSKDKTF
jgi:enamine deaminase RidA (YjgF/YER057c/UK114 family)